MEACGWKQTSESFIHLANQFGLSEQKGFNDTDKKEEDSLGDLLVQFSEVQEEIARLKVVESESGYRDQHALACRTGSITTLAKRLANLSDNLQTISRECPSIENKLSNPVLGNSLPFLARDHLSLIQGTHNLFSVVTQAYSLTASAEWICNQDWQTLQDQLDTLSAKLESSAARYRSACFHLQQLRSQPL